MGLLLLLLLVVVVVVVVLDLLVVVVLAYANRVCAVKIDPISRNEFQTYIFNIPLRNRQPLLLFENRLNRNYIKEKRGTLRALQRHTGFLF